MLNNRMILFSQVPAVSKPDIGLVAEECERKGWLIQVNFYIPSNEEEKSERIREIYGNIRDYKINPKYAQVHSSIEETQSGKTVFDLIGYFKRPRDVGYFMENMMENIAIRDFGGKIFNTAADFELAAQSVIEKGVGRLIL